MTEIRIDAAKAERTISQILRDEKKLLPADANAVAANICRRLSTATASNPQPLTGGAYRIISIDPPYASDFATAVANKLADASDRALIPEELWRLVYDRGRDLPATAVDP